jgi:membrane fusion protein, multidrug efflux system
MKEHLRTIVWIIIIIISAILFSKFLTKDKPKEITSIDQKIIPNVKVTPYITDTNYVQLTIFGNIKCLNKIDVFSEVGGVLLNDNFREGNQLNQGEILINIDQTEALNNLKSQKSLLINQVASIMPDLKIDFPQAATNWEQFLNQIDLSKNLPAIPETTSEKEKLFISGKNIFQTYYNLLSLEERLSKHTIYAPFNGIITQSAVKKGTLIRIGQKIGEFNSLNMFEMEALVSISDIAHLPIGTQLSIGAESIPQKSWTGIVKRINPKLDENTQMVKIFVEIKSDELKEGMFVKASNNKILFQHSFRIKRSFISNNHVMTVSDSLLNMKPVNILFLTDDEAIIEGLEPNEWVVTDNLKGLLKGMKVSPLHN